MNDILSQKALSGIEKIFLCWYRMNPSKACSIEFVAGFFCHLKTCKDSMYVLEHGLRTPNECINQRNLKFWADVADEICFDHT